MMFIYGSPRLQAARDYIVGRWRPPVLAFIQTQQLSSILLLLATIAALIWVNSPWDESYFDFWETEITVDVGLFSIEEHLKEWVNIGLMTIFFFVVAMEIKRELVHGELSTRRKAALPVLAALGGMIVPATVFIIFNPTGDGARGWGIPMATDIAFALGVLALLGRSLPSDLRVFLLALAVADDIGAILVIAVFYTEGLDLGALGWAFLMLGVIFTASRVLGLRSIPLYWILGLFFWVAVFKSGVHATIAGVALGMLAPANPLYPRQAFRPSAERLIERHEQTMGEGDEDAADIALGEITKLSQETHSPLDRLERQVNPWSSYVILPIFALANAGVVLSGDIIREALSSPITIGVAIALPLGNLIGITLFTWLAVRTGIGALPNGVTWPHIVGVALLAGIGFTVSIFISGLAYDNDVLTSEAKIGILIGSISAGILGYALLRALSARAKQPPPAVRDVSAEAS